MENTTDTAELTTYAETDVYGDVLDTFLLDGIDLLITLLAFILIVIASIKLVRGHKIPGARLIVSSIMLTVIITTISISYSLIFNIEENMTFEASLSIFSSLLFFTAAWGFLKLANFVRKNNPGDLPGPGNEITDEQD